MGKSLAVLKQQSPRCTIWKAYQNKMHQCTMYNIIHNIAVFQYLSKTCAASCDVIEISKLPSDWVFQKVEHSLLQIQVPYWLAALYAKYALILSFPSQKCALFLVLRGLCPFSSSMHPYRVSGITKPISWPININNMGKNFRISNVVAFE